MSKIITSSFISFLKTGNQTSRGKQCHKKLIEQLSREQGPAIDRMNCPKRGVEECKIMDQDVLGVNQLDEMASGVDQCSIPPKLPPHLSLAIYSPIFP